jgi:ribosomal protein L40E
MAKETLGYVKLEWVCPKCGSRNPGPEKTCLSCGAPQPENVAFVQADQQKLITEAEEVAKAKAGADIHCGFCGARNPAGTEICTQCGADLVHGTRREAGRVIGAFSTGPVKQTACPNCGQPNPETALKCANCGASLERTPAAEAASMPRPAAARSSRGVLGIGALLVVGILCLGAFIAFAVLSMRTEGRTGVVEGVSWTTQVTIEGLQPVDYDGWRDEIPADAQIEACSEKVFTVQDEPAPNSNKVCGTPYTVDKGSGYAEVVQDCQYEVLKDYCNYSVMEYRQVDLISQQGNDYSPAWPDPEIASDQRIGAKEQLFQIVFETSEGQYTYKTNDLSQYQQFQIGSEWILNINSFGNLVSVEPAK